MAPSEDGELTGAAARLGRRPRRRGDPRRLRRRLDDAPSRWRAAAARVRVAAARRGARGLEAGPAAVQRRHPRLPARMARDPHRRGDGVGGAPGPTTPDRRLPQRHPATGHGDPRRLAGLPHPPHPRGGVTGGPDRRPGHRAALPHRGRLVRRSTTTATPRRATARSRASSRGPAPRPWSSAPRRPPSGPGRPGSSGRRSPASGRDEAHRPRGRPAARRAGRARRGSLGVAADGPAVARVHHPAAHGPHALERRGEVVDGEVRQRGRVAGAAPAGVDADPRTAGPRLPPLPLRVLARLRGRPRAARPRTPARARVVGRELDEGRLGRRHRAEPRAGAAWPRAPGRRGDGAGMADRHHRASSGTGPANARPSRAAGRGPRAGRRRRAGG